VRQSARYCRRGGRTGSMSLRLPGNFHPDRRVVPARRRCAEYRDGRPARTESGESHGSHCSRRVPADWDTTGLVAGTEVRIRHNRFVVGVGVGLHVSAALLLYFPYRATRLRSHRVTVSPGGGRCPPLRLAFEQRSASAIGLRCASCPRV
jgi:hypothetical protein